MNSIVGVVDYVLSWQSKGLSDESNKPPTTSNNSLSPRLIYYGTKVRVQFTKSCLKQPNHTFTHKKIVNIYIVYEYKYKYSGYGIGFDRRSSFSFPNGGFGQMYYFLEQI